MTDFIVTITDQASLDGITWAREQYNASLPPPPPPMLDNTLPPPGDSVAGTSTNGNGSAPMSSPPIGVMPMADVPQPIETDEEYVQWVMEQAAISYADQKLRHQYRSDYEEAANAAGRKPI